MKLSSFRALVVFTALGASAQATDTNWTGLDQEIRDLSASLTTQTPTGPKVGGYIMTSLDYEGDPPIAGDDANDDGDFDDVGDTAPAEGDDVLGWRFRFVRLEVTGDLGHDTTYKVSFEMSSGTALLRDAYAQWKVADSITARWGRYKIPFVRSALVPDTKLLFLQRTRIADQFSTRDLGAMVTAKFDRLALIVNAQNGSDGINDELLYNARVTFELLGAGPGNLEGAYGAGEELGASVGAAIGDDSGFDDGVRWAVEGAMTVGRFSFAAELADFAEDVGNNSPWDATASFLLGEVYEIAARYEDLDTDENGTSYGAALNRYVAGHDIKWTLQWVHLDTDLEQDGIDFDRDQVALGLTVAF